MFTDDSVLKKGILFYGVPYNFEMGISVMFLVNFYPHGGFFTETESNKHKNLTRTIFYVHSCNFFHFLVSNFCI